MGANSLEESNYIYRTLAIADESAVKELLRRSFISTDWNWKYLSNPSFDPSLVAIAEENGKIVGCDHWLLRDVKLSRSSVAKAISAGDIAVDPSHRKRGIGRSLLLFQRKSILSNDRGAFLSYAFTSQELNQRLFQPASGYVPLTTSTVTYSKRWSWKQFIRRVEEVKMNVGPRDGFRGESHKRTVKIVFQVHGAPPLIIALGQGRIEAFEGNAEGVDLRVKSDLATLARLRRKDKRMRHLLKALLTGRLRISGGLLGIIGLYQNLDVLEQVFRFAL